MRLSRASTYAVHGLVYLATQPRDRLVPLSELRKERGLPAKHLAKIFQGLVRSGYLRAVRGVHGGFALLKPAAAITVLEIVHLVDGRPRSGECPTHPTALESAGCCSIQRLVVEGRRQMERVLAQTTLAQLHDNGHT